jgi:hypothetical protein
MEPTNEIDRILSQEEIVRPSNDFTARVMRRVRAEAAAPEPIEFPWRRFLPGMLTSLSLVLGTFMVLGWVNSGTSEPAANGEGAARATELLNSLGTAMSTPVGSGLLWAAGALILSGSLAWWAMRGGRAAGTSL